MAKKDAFSWEITDHACRVCLGRVLMRRTFDGKRVYRCACCGIEREGHSAASVCCCGIKLRQGHGQMDSGIRCVPNPERTPENMAQIVAVQVNAPAAEKTPRPGQVIP